MQKKMLDNSKQAAKNGNQNESKEPLSYRYLDIIRKELVSEGLITEDQLKTAISVQKSTQDGIGRILVRLDFVSKKKLVDFLGRHLGIPYLDLKGHLIDSREMELVPEEMARRYRLVPLSKIENNLTVAMADPLDIRAIDALVRRTRLTIEPMISTEEDIINTINQCYSRGRSQGILGKHKGDDLIYGVEATDQKPEDLAAIPRIIDLVNEIIVEAVRLRASDIHLEPEENNLPVRFRIDGILRKVTVLSKKLELAIVSRIKIMAGLDIAERRIPQDGSFTATAENRPIDLRVSTFPTAFGEKIVMRVLDRERFLIGLERLGFSPQTLKTFNFLIERPYGIILVTGPTSSGKTTTLYAVLNAIKSVEKNIITIEDPIECPIPMVRQSQINPKAGLTFARGLRSFLRQDPDIIMVGEIRDSETAEIAIRASLTGHLVLSTLHTNDAPGALTRLIDMGIAPYLVSSGIIGVLAQRLIRRVCPHCRQPYAEDREIITELGLPGENGLKLYRGKGCGYCGGTGYYGRIGAFELMPMNDKIKELVMSNTPTNILKEAAREAGMKTLREDALEKVIRGSTTAAEVMRVTSKE